MTHLLNNHIAVYPISVFEELRQHIREMLDANVIHESDSPYLFNVVLMRKLSGALCFFIDWRQLNNMTRNDTYMLPCFDNDILIF